MSVTGTTAASKSPYRGPEAEMRMDELREKAQRDETILVTAHFLLLVLEERNELARRVNGAAS